MKKVLKKFLVVSSICLLLLVINCSFVNAEGLNETTVNEMYLNDEVFLNDITNDVPETNTIDDDSEILNIVNEIWEDYLDQTGSNGEKILNEQSEVNSIVNTVVNVEVGTKLPQTGEETNEIVMFLSVIIVLGVIWLGLMLVIDHIKGRMDK